MLAAVLVFGTALTGCQQTSLKEALTVPPPVETKGTFSTATASTDAETSTSALTASSSGNVGTDTATTPSSVRAAAKSTTTSNVRRQRRQAQATRAQAAATTPQRTAAARTTAANGQTRQSGTASQNAPFVDEGARQGDTYPKFVPPKEATTQMTDAQKKAFEKTMDERMKANEQQADSPDAVAERRKLLDAIAKNSTRDTLKAIEETGQNSKAGQTGTSAQ
ncbi:hypothetical protein [Pararhizobium mangrovi]|uniref:Uncharacterized protein n=1 Tax=Pararhizobium mangrovi TaxID=2590452 RepID=A0A506TWB2_9HYPH|nr:hypothetical protein [Pararhizobium mangrovi]TPW26362.1 hypothetical protein FJU11_14905 [Pararhizobium mangrovi]